MVLPAPVGPTMAIVWPGSATSDSDSMSGLSGSYEKVTSRNSTRPVPAASRSSKGSGALLLGVEELEHPLERRDARLEDVHHRRELGERHRERARVLDERLHVADGDRAAGHPEAADDGDEHVLHVAQEHRRRLHEARHELGAERGLVELVVRVPEPLLDLVLAAERLHDRVAGEGLFDLRVQCAGVLPLSDEAGPGAAGDDLHRVDRHRDGGERHDRQQRRDREHHHRDTEQQQDRGEHLAERLLQALRDVVDVVGDPAQQVAPGLLVDVAERERVDLVFGRPQPVHEVLDEAGEDVRGEDRQQGGDAVQRDRLEQHVMQGTEVDPTVGDHAAEDDVGPVSEHAGTEHVEHGAADGGANDGIQEEPVVQQPTATAGDGPKSFDFSSGTPAEFHRPDPGPTRDSARGAALLLLIRSLAESRCHRRLPLADLGLHDLGVGRRWRAARRASRGRRARRPRARGSRRRSRWWRRAGRRSRRPRRRCTAPGPRAGGRRW